MKSRPNYKGPEGLQQIHAIPAKDAPTPESSEYGMDMPATMPKLGFTSIGDGCYRRKSYGSSQ